MVENWNDRHFSSLDGADCSLGAWVGIAKVRLLQDLAGGRNCNTFLSRWHYGSNIVLWLWYGIVGFLVTPIHRGKTSSAVSRRATDKVVKSSAVLGSFKPDLKSGSGNRANTESCSQVGQPETSVKVTNNTPAQRISNLSENASLWHLLFLLPSQIGFGAVPFHLYGSWLVHELQHVLISYDQ